MRDQFFHLMWLTCVFALSSSIIGFCLVIERVCAAVFKSYKFYFDLDSPIFINYEAFIVFFAMLSFLTILWALLLKSKKSILLARQRRIIILAAILNGTSMMLFLLLMASPFAKFSTS